MGSASRGLLASHASSAAEKGERRCVKCETGNAVTDGSDKRQLESDSGGGGKRNWKWMSLQLWPGIICMHLGIRKWKLETPCTCSWKNNPGNPARLGSGNDGIKLSVGKLLPRHVAKVKRRRAEETASAAPVNGWLGEHLSRTAGRRLKGRRDEGGKDPADSSVPPYISVDGFYSDANCICIEFWHQAVQHYTFLNVLKFGSNMWLKIKT